MKNKGFTLIELMAVIVLLAILSTGSITLIMKSRKSANKKLYEGMERDIVTAGENLYSYEKISGNKTSDYFYPTYRKIEVEQSIYISAADLKDAGYLKKMPNSCKGFLQVMKMYDGPEFQGYIDCGTDYKTENYDRAEKLGKEKNVELTSK